jgi:hypothetical protein
VKGRGSLVAAGDVARDLRAAGGTSIAIARTNAQRAASGQRAQNWRAELRRVRACDPTETSVGRRVDASDLEMQWQRRDVNSNNNSARQNVSVGQTQSSRKSKYHWESDHLIFTPAACSDLMQLLDQMLQLLGSYIFWRVGLTWQRSWTRRMALGLGGVGSSSGLGVPAAPNQQSGREPWLAPWAPLMSDGPPRHERCSLLSLAAQNVSSRPHMSASVQLLMASLPRADAFDTIHIILGRGNRRAHALPSLHEQLQ